MDDIHGWDLAEDDNDPTNTPKDAEGYWIHGTHTAGLASAVTNNGVGVAGVSWNCEILPVKCSRDNSPKSVVAGYQGIQYAADMGADVINCSWGGFGSFSQALQDVIDYAHALGSLIVASAGNDPTDAPHYPSAYWNVLSVTWVGRNDVKSSDAPWGPTVDVAAPGELLHSTIPVAGGSYGTMSGSSAAAPLVSGLCGLVKAAHKDWSNADMAFQVVETADNIDEKNPDYIGQLGSGRINAYRALTETVSPKPKIFLLSYTIDDTQGGNGNGAIEAGEQVRLMVKLKNEWGDATNVIAHLRINDWAVTVTKSTSSWGIIKGLRNITANVVDNSTDPFIIAIDSLALPHRIPVKVELTADNGYAQSYHFALAITPSILLVDDDEIDVEKYYIAILDSLHYSFEYWEHEQKGTPGDLSAFSTVIWSCEWTFPSLDAEDRKVITNYLDEGGNLFLTGQDIGWDLCDPATIQDPSLPDNQFELSNGASKTFYETYLHAHYLLDDSEFSTLTGVADDPIGDGLSFSVYQPGREADNQYPSEVDTINGGISIFNYPNGSSGAVRYAADYRVVYFAFGGWEAIVEPEVRAEVMARVLDWLNGLKVEHTPVKDTEDTAHDYKVTVKVTSSVQPVGRVELYWDTDGALPFKKIPMTDLGDGQYQAFIPAQPLGTEIQYLIFVQTTTGYYSPYTIYSFHVGADTTPPVFVSINKAPNTLDKKGPYPFSATIEDNQGVDTSSVYVHFKLADGRWDSLKMSPGSRLNLFEALIPGGVSYGDTIAYYLSAQDIASVPNRALSQTYRFVVGYEDFESGLGFWEVVGEGWGLDASARYSGDYSVNESPGGNYPPNTNTALTMKSGLDLSSTSYAALFFWTRYLLQYNKAFGYVEVSVDSGKTWKQLGDPIARLQSQWVQKGLSLQDYVGHTDVRLRFRLVSDATALPNFDDWF
ncbi:MAG: S8 family serine peptidase, partial [candidate division KSB1 bacterium]|nr:S8 family serine peptidase [candidate division KSB1 bacterium]